MENKLKYFIFVGFFLFAQAFATTHLANQAFEHVVWRGMPLNIQVPVGVERTLKFPGSVKLQNNDARLSSDKLSMMQNNGFLYIKARKAFDPIRLYFILKKTGKGILIDLSAKKNASDTPLEIVNALSQEKSHKKPQVINYVSLFRYAIQHLYAPLRLIESNTRISRTPMYTTKSVDLFPHGSVLAMPLHSWQGGRLYVTAVLLKNVSPQSIALDPRVIRGHWLAASFYPTNALTHRGSKHDRTTLFLISDRSFGKALDQLKEYRP